ncbi:MAG: pyruvate, water dikinase [Desulfovibrionaceae bacterium]|nr:pyruvate, water dikinase [Desulfovibrionaceae bacterium]
MRAAIKTFFNFIHRQQDRDTGNREKFLAKSENFRLLLAANNKALETMAEMQEASRSGRVLGIAHVRAQSLKVAAGVRQMIERLCRMAPGKYEELRQVFNDIVQTMDKTLNAHAERPVGPLVLDLDDIHAGSLPETGSKMALLGEVRAKLGVRVPEGFSITASAFHLFMERTRLFDEINRLIQIHGCGTLEELQALEESIRNAIDMAPLPPELEKAMTDACEKMDDPKLAVRSSALCEDTEMASYAGQFLSMLGVKPRRLADAYRAVLASLYSATAMTYTLNRGLREDEMVMAVGCMEMVRAVAGGVIYTRFPMGDNNRRIVINAVRGLPCAVVDGSTQADSFVIDRKTLDVVDKEIAEKSVRYVLGRDGRIGKEKLYGEASVTPAISDEDAVRLAKIAARIEEHFRHPQDIEWAMKRNGQIYILQCRPLAVCKLPASPPPDDDADRLFALLSGCIPASPGAASGYVVKVETDSDMLRFPDGAVLLARTAKPQLSALLPRASALITEYGSAAGHLANVSREFGIPALIGAPGAMERLSGVSIVTVNGTTGTIYLGHREQQIVNAAARNEPRRATDVSQALEGVMQYVSPLSLTDPESPDFRPEMCRSLHDITRFCHEKGVAEMFAMGDRPSGSARRLKTDRHMQYWLVDIGGGTSGSDEDKAIGLEDVRSNPMQALWKGMTAIPWDGPPPACAKGFMSVLTTAAQTPGLAPGAANSMGERNYFIVGRNYCNLQSRFGFHFCTIEGFAGDDPGENYALFQFQGGGADMARRNIRTRMVADILERRGFIVEVREDSLFARLERVSRPAVEQAMAILGYLLMHTRQIDMAMADPEAERRYREKFDTDIAAILADIATEPDTARYLS